eukprot:Seg1915.2 transcript_id=Seg1915.2/GoldUCD/mRNA.D3Y31 product="hypothetical protein" protein_id=Seg1915.2/GoldUCD/D3Y31
MKDHMRSQINDMLLNVSNDAYTDAFINILAINTSRTLMDNDCLENALTSVMKTHIANCSDKCQPIKKTFADLQSNVITLEECVNTSKAYLTQQRSRSLQLVLPTYPGVLRPTLSGRKYYENVTKPDFVQNTHLKNRYEVPKATDEHRKEVADYLHAFLPSKKSRKRVFSDDLEPDYFPPTKLPAFESSFCTPSITATNSTTSLPLPKLTPVKQPCLVKTPPHIPSAIRRLDFNDSDDDSPSLLAPQAPLTSLPQPRQCVCSGKWMRTACTCASRHEYATFPATSDEVPSLAPKETPHSAAVTSSFTPTTRAVNVKKAEISSVADNAVRVLNEGIQGKAHELKGFCWSWNKNHRCEKAATMRRGCSLKHVCLGKLPNGTRCRSEKHTFVEHYQFFKTPLEEAQRLLLWKIIDDEQYKIVLGIVNESSRRLVDVDYDAHVYDSIVDAESMLNGDGDLKDTEFYMS